MSRFYNNRGGMGMGMGMGMGLNNFGPRRGGPGGPMRGGFMGNQQFRNHPFQNPNQNRGRGGFNKPANHTPQKPPQTQGPAPTPGPALTMKVPVKEENKEKQIEQPKPVTPALPATPKIPSPPPKPTVTSTTPSKPQEQQIKPEPANVNGQQPKQAPPPTPQEALKPPQQQATPKPFQSSTKPIPQAPKPIPQSPKPAPQQAPQQQAPKPAPQHPPKPAQQPPPKPPHQQLQNQGNKGPQQQGPRPGGAGHPGQGGPRPQQNQTGPRPGPYPQGHRQGQRGGHNQGHRGGFQQRPPARPREEEPKPMETEQDSEEDRPKINFKLSMLLKPGEKSYTQRCRLFVGNMPNDMTEEEFTKMFSKYGAASEVFINKAKGFGFIRLESRALAEIAKAELDDTPIKGRQLRVRFATHSAALSIKNLSPFVSNELLEEAFLQFGLVERAIVIVDDRGRSTGKGIVEFASKPAARKALDRCNDGVFLLTSSPRPVVVEPLEQFDDEDGLPEKLAQKNPRYQIEREHPPRFAHPGSFEFEYSKRWKSLDEMEKQQRQQVEKNMQEAREKLESEMEDAYHEHQANLLRQDLLRRQEELRRMEELHSQEMQKRKEMQLRQEEERRRREEEMLRKREMEEQMRRQREESYRMGGNFMDQRDREMRLSSTGTLGIGEMSYSTPSQKFSMSAMSYEGQQGLSGSPNIMSSDMRSDRFSQSSTRGMGAGNGGYGRVREEYEGSAKKPRF